jgi:lysine-N-methylase
MISIIPEGFNEFVCKAGRCRHTCCQLWEIDIDDDTAAYYLHLKGPMGDKLRRNMEKNEEGWHFKLRKDRHCGMLRPDGLCEVITELGEDKLCDICMVHPRFFTYAGEFILCGTGLCCERTCEILMDGKQPLAFHEEDTDFIYSFRELLEFMGFSISEALSHFTPRPDEGNYRNLLSDLAATDPIDEAWTREMAELTKDVPAVVTAAGRYSATYDPLLFDRLYQFIFYRQLDKAETYGLEAVAEYARRSTEFIFLEAARLGDVGEQMRRWSEQIEYDTGNVDFLIQQL